MSNLIIGIIIILVLTLCLCFGIMIALKRDKGKESFEERWDELYGDDWAKEWDFLDDWAFDDLKDYDDWD